MARAYSVDLREKVLNFIASGATKKEAAEIFEIGEDSIYRWQRLEKKQGHLKPKKHVFLPQKVNLEELKSYVEKNPDHTLKEIAESLNLGLQTVWKWLKRLGITRKKKRYCTRNVMQKNAQNSKKKLNL